MVKANDPSALDTLVNEVLSSSKYRDISPELVRSIGMQELSKRRTIKEAVKSTKSKLHQVGGAYLDERKEYRFWLDLLQFQSPNRIALQQACRQIMSQHASTRERLPILDQFYFQSLSGLAIHSVIDIACGLNPLAIPWMPLEKDAEYYAYDIYQNMMDFLGQYMQLLPIKGHAKVRDVLQACPTQSVDVALVLKAIPCLEQVDKQAGYRLLRTLNAKHLVVSFPIHSLGGRNKGMATNYEAHFWELLDGETWEVKRFEFATELVFVVSK
ncbi:MAG TPA: hypothetical protein VFB12_12730 [Ktedonobacteraceae bacterium]|nr:hypothetical protein [Ktedonobacteraceae bacterium]